MGSIYDLTDTVPAGWTVSDISNGGTENGGVITWTDLQGSFTGAGVSYSVMPPPAANGEVCFSGTGEIDGIPPFATVGDDCVRPVVQETFAQWAARNGVAAIPTGPGSNPDGDNDENLLEFAFATNPNDPGSVVAQRTLKINANGIEFPIPGGPGQIRCLYIRSKTATGITYNVQSADDTQFPNFVSATILIDRKIGEGPDTILREVVVEVPPGASSFFIRIEVTVP